jgi:hypothetical protein
MFCCGFCRKEYLLYSNLCPKCDKIYKLGTIYGFDKIYDVVDKSLVISQEKKLDKVVIRKKSV